MTDTVPAPVETVDPDEPTVVAEFIGFLKEASLARHPSGPILRFNQGRGTGCVQAEFTIDADLAPFSKRPLNSYQAEVLEGAYKDLSGADLADNAAADRLLGSGASEHPPFGNRGAMRDWMVDNGHWSPRTQDANFGLRRRM